MARADVIAAVTVNTAVHFNGGGTNYLVKSVNGVYPYYMFFVDGANDLSLTKSYDGITWTTPSVLHAGTMIAISVWYRRWSGINSDVVDIAFTESVNSDIRYLSLDLSTETLGSEIVVFNGVSTASGGSLSITTCRDGTLRVVGSIDNGVEDGAWSSIDNGATWGDTIADPSEGATNDQYYALPGYNSDQADFMIVFVDASANGLSVKRYDDSANTWTETALITDTNFVDVTPSTNYPHVACVADVTNSRNIVIAWGAVDSANADLRCFIITDTTITEVTNVVLNSTDDQGFAALGIDTTTGDWYAFYGGSSDGAQTFPTSIALYYKVSTDDGATWGSETRITWTDDFYSILWLACTPQFDTEFIVAFLVDRVNDQIMVSGNLPASGGNNVASPIFDGYVLQ